MIERKMISINVSNEDILRHTFALEFRTYWKKKEFGETWIRFTIFWDFLMVEQNFLSPQLKGSMIISK